MHLFVPLHVEYILILLFRQNIKFLVISINRLHAYLSSLHFSIAIAVLYRVSSIL